MVVGNSCFTASNSWLIAGTASVHVSPSRPPLSWRATTALLLREPEDWHLDAAGLPTKSAQTECHEAYSHGIARTSSGLAHAGGQVHENAGRLTKTYRRAAGAGRRLTILRSNRYPKEFTPKG